MISTTLVTAYVIFSHEGYNIGSFRALACVSLFHRSSLRRLEIGL